MASINFDLRRIAQSKAWAMLLLVFFIAVIAFSAFYLLSGYDHLVKWYNGLNDCFYKNNTWTTEFFTPRVKATGNKYCIVALLISLTGIGYLFRNIKRKKLPTNDQLNVSLQTQDLLLFVCCLAVTTLAWFWGRSLVAPSTDEVFSAVNCAGIHPIQALSYYMAPNNHILFNLINNILFHPAIDKVFTGKIISLLCYWDITIISFFWLKQLIPNKWLVLVATLTLSLQFPIWAFSFQARGYELLALLSWVSFICILQYLTYHGKRLLLYIQVIVCCLGYLCVPSFLYFHAALIGFAILYQLLNRKLIAPFWIAQLICMAFVFLLYLPALCFSGLSAIAGNQYVTQAYTYSQLIKSAVPIFHAFMEYCFAGFITGNHQFDLLLFLLPLCLLFYRQNKSAFPLGLFYIAMWTSTSLITVLMHQPPIDRALTAQFSISLALTIYTIYLLVASLSSKQHVKLFVPFIMTILLATLSINFMFKDKINSATEICHFPINNGYYELMNNGITLIPAGSSVSFSNSAFYCYYLCREKGCHASKCPEINDDYFINYANNQLPPWVKENYNLIQQNVMGYDFYKRK